MSKDRRYITVKNLIAAGYIKTFREIFETIPKTVVASDLGMNNIRFSSLIDNVERFKFRDIFHIASLFETDELVFLNLIHQQHLIDQKKGKGKNRTKADE